MPARSFVDHLLVEDELNGQKPEKTPFETQPFVKNYLQQNGMTTSDLLRQADEADANEFANREKLNQDVLNYQLETGTLGPDTLDIRPDMLEGLNTRLDWYNRQRAARPSLSDEAYAQWYRENNPWESGVNAPTPYDTFAATPRKQREGQAFVNGRPAGGQFQLKDKDTLLNSMGAPAYAARLQDYLDAEIKREQSQYQQIQSQLAALESQYREQVNQINGQALGEQISADDAKAALNQLNLAFSENQQAYTNQLNGFSFIDAQGRPTKANAILQEAEDRINRGFFDEENLPFFNQVRNVFGPAASALYQKYVQGEVEAKNKADQSKAAQKEQARIAQATPRVEPKQDFLAYVNSLNLTPEYRRWLLSQYGGLQALWRQSGESEFLTWLNNYLAGRQ